MYIYCHHKIIACFMDNEPNAELWSYNISLSYLPQLEQEQTYALSNVPNARLWCTCECVRAGNMHFSLPCLHFPRPRMERGSGRLLFTDNCHIVISCCVSRFPSRARVCQVPNKNESVHCRFVISNRDHHVKRPELDLRQNVKRTQHDQ